MLANQVPERARSRSPRTVTGTKLHISNLPVNLENQDIQNAFQRYGSIEDIRIIRKGNNGQPLKETCYGFVVMTNEREAKAAMEELNNSGWTISWSKETMERQAKLRERGTIEQPMPSLHSLTHNIQATHLMLSNNANPNPGQPINSHFIDKLLQDNHPNSANISSVPLFFQPYMAYMGSLMVREVWIGNISPATEKKALYDTFKVYGEIEGIEMFSSKGFAFIKYRRIVSATLAYEYAQQALVDGRPVKVAFADPTRRVDIVGDSADSLDPEFNPIDDEHFKSLYLGYSLGIKVPSEGKLLEVFERYGQVRSIHVNQGKANTRPYAFVDFEKGEQASLARQRLYIDDYDGTLRYELGDPSLEISFKSTNNIVSRTGTKNGVRYQFKAEKHEIQEITRKLMSTPPELLSSFTIPQQYPQAISTPHQQPTPQPTAQAPSQTREEDSNAQIGNVVWSGFMTRSKAYKVGIDATLVKGNPDFLSEVYHVNISHRAHFDDAVKYHQLGVVTLEPSNELQLKTFNKYIDYFRTKQKGGFVQLKSAVMYVLPPVPKALELYDGLQQNQLLGIISDLSRLAEVKDKVTPEIAEQAAALGASPFDPRLKQRI